jgi:Kdo2-lipid IVA lauroyltransferase/acyltransferase
MSPSRGAADRVRQGLKTSADAALGALAVGMLRTIRAINRKRMADFAGSAMRALGPRLKEHRIGRANLAAAFPEKSPSDIEAILRDVWDNLGRVAAEFAHIDRLEMLEPDPHDLGDMLYTTEVYDRFRHLRDDGKPALIFAAHLANWELPALVASKYRLETTVLYRRPNIGAISDAIIQIRKGSMGTLVSTGLDAPLKLSRVLEAGGHVAMLVDQHYVNGVDVTFFGRRCKANPFIARLARHIDCPIHGTRAVRLSDRHRFRIDLTDAIEPRRDAEGKIDVEGTMQVITSVVEGWVREHPEQWLWVHRRWR